VTFAFEDATTFEAATKNVTKVFLLGPPLNTNLEALLTPFISYLKRLPLSGWCMLAL